MYDWSSGYVADIGYTFGYYAELNPLRVRLAFLNQGLAFPENGAACELGFGQGLSANVHGAASVTQWFGTDFNPAQAGFAQELATASGASAQLYDESFAEFAARSDLPLFDFIGLHGIWSWVNDENRATIVEFIRTRLKVGGVVYISYNTQPGWAAFTPMRHLLTLHAELQGAPGQGTVARIAGAFDFADKLFATDPAYVRANPQVRERFDKVKTQDRHYLAHEYFNRDWLPMHFATVEQWLAPAKLDFACSAHYIDHLDLLNLNTAQQELLGAIDNATLRQTARDFIMNQQFRRDYWVKGARKLSAVEQAEQQRLQRVMLVVPREDVSLKIKSPMGEADLSAKIYVPLLDLLADYKPRTLGQMEAAMADKGVNFAKLWQAILVLAGQGSVSLAQGDDVVAKVRVHTDRLNAHILAKARSGGDIGFLASPLTGGGVALDQFFQLFLLAISQGKKQPVECAAEVWKVLLLNGRRIIKDGKNLESPEENIEELTRRAVTFQQKQLPVLKALMIAS